MSVLVHIGFAKAASTFLQAGLFSGRHPLIDPLGGPHGPQDPALGKCGGQLFLNGGALSGARARVALPFAFEAERVRDIVLAGRAAAKPVTVISDEALAGHPYSGGVAAETVCAHIRAALPEAKILIVLREQRAMLLSAYADYLLRHNGTARLSDFLAPRRADQIPGHAPEFYAFARLVEGYIAAFGAQNVLVLPMELLAARADGLSRPIEAFLGLPEGLAALPGTPVNARDERAYAALRLMPFANALGKRASANGNAALGVPALRSALVKPLRWALPGPARRAVLAADRARIAAHLAPLIGADNLRLQRYVPFDLAALGYLMGAD